MRSEVWYLMSAWPSHGYYSLRCFRLVFFGSGVHGAFWLKKITLKWHSLGVFHPPRPERFAMFAGAINLVGGLVMLYVVFCVVVLALPYSTWSAIAGSTIWMKLIFDFILSRHARLISKP